MNTLVVLVYAGLQGHGAIVSPRSRNSVDAFAHPPVQNVDSCSNVSGTGSCENGQAAHWYSQGCSIGCPTCDHVSGRRQIDICGKGKIATVNDPLYRTVNRDAVAGSKFDIYRWNPWRAPGTAPVADACGLAGGTPWGADAPEEGKYVNTSYAHHGMKGTDLPALPTGVVWTIGLEAEVTWQVRNNHGGGYAYRLCPADSPLTEACFQSHPLEFMRDEQALVLSNGTMIPIKGTFLDVGTSPEGSTWAMIPIPPTVLGPRCVCSPDLHYKPANYDCGCLKGEERDSCTSPGNCSAGACLPCPGTPGSDCSRCGNIGKPQFPDPCPGGACRGWPGPAVRDVVKVPADLAPGKYVLGFRYDCESTAQVWSNCADITLAL